MSVSKRKPLTTRQRRFLWIVAGVAGIAIVTLLIKRYGGATSPMGRVRGFSSDARDRVMEELDHYHILPPNTEQEYERSLLWLLSFHRTNVPDWLFDALDEYHEPGFHF